VPIISRARWRRETENRRTRIEDTPLIRSAKVISLGWPNRCVIGPFRDLNSICRHLRRFIAIVSVQGSLSRRFPVILKIIRSSHRSRWQQAIRFINNSLMSLRNVHANYSRLAARALIDLIRVEIPSSRRSALSKNQEYRI